MNYNIERKIEKLIEEAVSSTSTSTTSSSTSGTPTPSSETGASQAAQNIVDSFKQGPDIINKSPIKEIPKLDTLQDIAQNKQDSGFAGLNFRPPTDTPKETINDTLTQTSGLERLMAISHS